MPTLTLVPRCILTILVDFPYFPRSYKMFIQQISRIKKLHNYWREIKVHLLCKFEMNANTNSPHLMLAWTLHEAWQKEENFLQLATKVIFYVISLFYQLKEVEKVQECATDSFSGHSRSQTERREIGLRSRRRAHTPENNPMYSRKYSCWASLQYETNWWFERFLRRWVSR